MNNNYSRLDSFFKRPNRWYSSIIIILVGLSAVHPGIQFSLNQLLIRTALGVDLRSMGWTIIFMVSGGWVFESMVKAYPYAGAMPLANLIVGLIVFLVVRAWPTQTFAYYMFRLLLTHLLHLGLFIIFCYVLNDVWAWDSAYLLSLGLLPFTAIVTYQMTSYGRRGQ